MPSAQLMNPEALHALLNNAINLLAKSKSQWSKEGIFNRSEWLAAAKEAIRFCVVSAKESKDVSLLEPLAAAVEAAAIYADLDTGAGNILTVMTGVKSLLAHATELSPEV